MNILVIGNGFDLAHGLPTKYEDFLDFCKMVDGVYKDASKEKKKIQNGLKDFFDEKKLSGRYDENEISYEMLDEFYCQIKDNGWIKYFLNKYKNRELGDNWIGFEAEISKVIQAWDSLIQLLEEKEAVKSKFGDDNEAISKFFVHQYGLSPFKEGKGFDFQWISVNRKLLEEGLNKLIRALEIYLSCFVEKLHIKKQISEIKDIDYVISFNYTHIFSAVYKESTSCIIDYIHGEAKRENTIEKDNMVLGIDEYLSDDRKDKDVDFIVFKKYYQRIYKGTGCEYKKWLNQIQNKYAIYLENRAYCEEMKRKARQRGDFMEASKWSVEIQKIDEENEINNLYIFGHSLDVTDKDILRDLILQDNMYTTIYYHKTDDDKGGDDNGRKDLGSKIANLVKVIGQDELIRRTGGSTKTIEFKLQQDMMKI